MFKIDLDNLCDWATLNELDFQPKKCVNLRISRKLCSFDRVYIINRMDQLKCVSSQRDLGVAVTKNLSWNDHIEQISAKANKMLGFIKRNCSRDLPSNALKALYLALVRSHLGYCCQLWAPQSVIRNILLIESIQRRATKFLCKYPNATTSCKIVETLSLKNTFSSFQCPPYLEFKPFPLPLPPPPFNVDCLSSQHFFLLLATLIRGGGGLQCER